MAHCSVGFHTPDATMQGGSKSRGIGGGKVVKLQSPGPAPHFNAKHGHRRCTFQDP